MTVAHLIKKIEFRSLCGIAGDSYLAVYPSRNADGYFDGGTGRPVGESLCETCILIHFANPENTEYLED